MLTGAGVLTGIVVISLVVWSRNGDRTQAALPSSDLGPQFTRVTSDASFSTEPALSRDGTLVVYASDREGGGQLDLWLQRTTGGRAIRLTDNPADDREPDVSPDGSLIAFRSDRNGGGIFVMPTLPGDARLVAELGRSPRFSPDGKRIAYWTGPWLGGPRTPGSGIFVAPAIGGAAIHLAEGFVAARTPVWSPDGHSLIFFGRKSTDDSTIDWWWISLDGGEPVPTGAYRLLGDKGLLVSVADPSTDVLPAAWTTTGVLFSARRGESANRAFEGPPSAPENQIEASLND